MNPLENPVRRPQHHGGRAQHDGDARRARHQRVRPALWDQRGGSQLTPNPYRSTMRLA